MRALYAARIKKAAEEADALTWAQAIERYCAARGEECTARSIDTLKGRLKRFFGAAALPRPARITQEQAQALYDALRPTVSVQDHRHCLSRAKALGAWLVSQGSWKDNPIARVKPVGKPKRGKPQLTKDEARQLLRWCMAEHTRDEGAAAVAVLIAFGLRATELCEGLTVRSLDDGGRILHVHGTKTDAARRSLGVPHPTPAAPDIPDLRHVLQLQAVRARKREQSAEVPSLAPAPWGRNRWWVGREVERCCRAAGVPVVPPHGLRGTWASLARAASAAPAIVAEALGHSGTQVQDRHYVDPAAAAAGAQGAVVGALRDGHQMATKRADRAATGSASATVK